jgi:two-component system OmpR family sensor kinase
MGRLFWKIFFSLWLALLLSASIVGLIVWSHNQQRIKNLELLVDNPKAEFRVNVIAELLQRNGVPAVNAVIKRHSNNSHRRVPVFIVAESGLELYGRAVPKEMLEKVKNSLYEPQQSAIRQVTTPQGKTFLVFIPRRDHFNKFMHKPIRFMPLWPLAIIFIMTFIFSFWVAWYITRPVKMLREATRQFSQGKLDTRVAKSMGQRKDEITSLAFEFDDMADRLQKLIAIQKNLLNDVSHELRSPLARLKMAVEVGRQQPDKIESLMVRIEKEIHRLDELVGELLTLSRLEANNRLLSRDYFDFNGLVQAIVNDACFEAQHSDKQIQYQAVPEIEYIGNIELIRRAIENCVRNAVFYTPEKGTVSITLANDNATVVLKICDSGAGVQAEKLPHLFDPFIRMLDEQQNIHVPGYGLGLAIAKRAVEIHQGKIQAFNQPQGGLCIEIMLPKRCDS